MENLYYLDIAHQGYLDNNSQKKICDFYLLCILLYHTWEKFGGIKFWQIATEEANGEETFGGSNHRSSVVSLYLQVLVGKNLYHVPYLPKFYRILPLQIFPAYGILFLV